MNPQNDDLPIQSYQDDLTTDENATDPVMDAEGDDPVEDLGVPADIYKAEMDNLAIDENDAAPGVDDQREQIEGLDLDSGDNTKY